MVRVLSGRRRILEPGRYRLWPVQLWLCTNAESRSNLFVGRLQRYNSFPYLSETVTNALPEIVGDSLTAVTTCRNTMSTIFVFAIAPWTTAFHGLPNVFNFISGIGICILSFAGVFIWKGKHWRWRFAARYKYFAERQFEGRPL